MYTMKRTKDDCPVEAVVELIGGKWKPIILYYLHRDGTLRFSELKRACGSVTQRMLTTQLRSLEADGLVNRTVHPVVPPHVDYSLTPLGESLYPVLEAMKQWSLDHIKH